MNARRAFAVVDLGFGDAGKGALTDALARHHPIDLVVRFNGGAQAGHNVVTPDGLHHTFAQIGSATLARPGVRTLLSRFVVVHPTALLVEAQRLEAKGVRDVLGRVAIDERALVTTPFHQAACRIRERARGAARHGSCGVGVGETVADALAAPDDAVLAADLRSPARLYRKLCAVRERKHAELSVLVDPARDGDDAACFADDALAVRWVESVATPALSAAVVAPDDVGRMLRAARGLVFEGAQGVLLDEDHGFHPHTTWSHCTFRNAEALAREHALDASVVRLGVVRAHAVRHGAGPLPTEDPTLPSAERHNVTGPWQGAVRVGHLDLVLLRYALAACGGVDGLVVSHLDGVTASHRVVRAYTGPADPDLVRRDASGAIVALSSTGGSLAVAERLGRVLDGVRPVLEPLADPLGTVREATGVPIAGAGWGPTAADWRLGELAARLRGSNDGANVAPCGPFAARVSPWSPSLR